MTDATNTDAPAVGSPVERGVGRPVPERAKLWRVVRYVREEFEVEAGTRDEALAAISDPHTVTVTRQTCVLSGGEQ